MPKPHWPAVEGGRIIKRYRFGDHQAVVFTDLDSLGPVRYLYLMVVFSSDADAMPLCLASERATFYDELPPDHEAAIPEGAYFLGVFSGDGHSNLGASRDWANLETFTTKALEVARDRLGVEAQPTEVVAKRPWWRFW